MPDVILAKLAPGPAMSPRATLIGPSAGWRFINLGELWHSRDLVFFLAWRDVKVRYKQTALGIAWAVLQPALMMVVFTLFFGMRAGLASGGWPYPLFALAGLLPWTFFATALTNAANSVVGSERLVTKVYFPRLAIPLASVGSVLVDFLVSLGLLGVVMAYYRTVPGWGLILAPAIFVVLLLAAVGFGTFLAALNVAYRDFRYVVPFLIQIWMFATPALYMDMNQAGHPPSRLVAWCLYLNPLNGLIAAFRASVLDGTIPWLAFGAAGAACLTIALLGCLYFRKVEDGFADII